MCTSSMATTRMEMENTCGLTYSVSRAIEVTAWQSDDAVCLCYSTHSSSQWTQISSGYSDGGYQQHMPKKMALICPCHLHMTFSMCWTSLCATCFSQASLTVPVLYMCVLQVIFCGLRFSHILIIVLCMQLVHILHVHSLRLALQCHTFIQY